MGTQQGTQKLAAFKAWMTEVGITWNNDLITLQAGCDGWGIYAAQELTGGDKLCTIPKTAILSVLTTSCADILQQEGLRGGLGLVVAILYEWCQGKKSKWHTYLESLPAREYLPVFWTDQELELLHGTSLEGKAEEARQAMQQDWEDDVKALANKYRKRIPKAKWTLDNFMVAAGWMSSRAFKVDSSHGDSLVPLADVFNHKASVVQLSDEYEVADDEEEDEDENQDDEGEEDEEEEEVVTDGDASDDGSGDEAEAGVVLAGGIKAVTKRGSGRPPAAHKTKADKGDSLRPAADAAGTAVEHVSKQASSVEEQQDAGHVWQGVDLRLQIAICSSDGPGEADEDEDDEDEDDEGGGDEGVLDIVAAVDLPAGSQVYNTYGEHGDAELVVKYGFALMSNPFNEVQLDAEAVVNAAQALLTSCPPDLLAAFLGNKSASASSSSQKDSKKQGKKTASKKQGSSSTSDLVAQEVARRVQWIKNTSALLPEDDEEAAEDSLCVLPGRAVNTSTWLLLTALTAPKNEMDTWMRSGAGMEAVLLSAARTSSTASDKQEAEHHAKQHTTEMEEEDEQVAGPPGVVKLTREALAARFSHRVPLPDWQQQSEPPQVQDQMKGKKRKGRDSDSAGDDASRKRPSHGQGQPALSTWTCACGAHQTSELHSADGKPKGWQLLCPACVAHGICGTSTSPDGDNVYIWTSIMRAVLQEVVLQRLALYVTGSEGSDEDDDNHELVGGVKGQHVQELLTKAADALAHDEQKLAQASKIKGEAGVAANAALTLRVGEQRMLLAVLETAQTGSCQ